MEDFGENDKAKFHAAITREQDDLLPVLKYELSIPSPAPSSMATRIPH
jgi:hypothetical protein